MPMPTWVQHRDLSGSALNLSGSALSLSLYPSPPRFPSFLRFVYDVIIEKDDNEPDGIAPRFDENPT
jgi:hypothetical protein